MIFILLINVKIPTSVKIPRQENSTFLAFWYISDAVLSNLCCMLFLSAYGTIELADGRLKILMFVSKQPSTTLGPFFFVQVSYFKKIDEGSLLVVLFTNCRNRRTVVFDERVFDEKLCTSVPVV